MNPTIIAFFFVFVDSMGYEIMIEISISKIKNRMARKKNWNENGVFVIVILLNPHSNLLHFSLVDFNFFWNTFTVTRNTRTIAAAINHMIEIFIT